MYKVIKRGIDILAALILLVLTSPLLLLSFLLIKMESPKESVLFRQIRVGKDDKEFVIHKYRTMNNKKDDDGNLLPDNQRQTKVGKFLRKTSIDELPQLLNILKGDMSFIGPRPLPVQYLPWYSEEELKRHTVLPGISGWAQVNGRNNISWDEKLKYDIYYVDNMSFLLDFKIVCMTLMKVIKSSDVVTRDTENIGEVDFDKYRQKEISNR